MREWTRERREIGGRERVREGLRVSEWEKGEGQTNGLTRPIFEDTCVCPKKCAERKTWGGSVRERREREEREREGERGL